MKQKTHSRIITVFFGLCAILGMIALSTIPYFVIKPETINGWILTIFLGLVTLIIVTMFALGLFVSDMTKELDNE